MPGSAWPQEPHNDKPEPHLEPRHWKHIGACIAAVLSFVAFLLATTDVDLSSGAEHRLRCPFV